MKGFIITCIIYKKHTDHSGEEVHPEAFTLDPFYTVEIGSQFIIYFWGFDSPSLWKCGLQNKTFTYSTLTKIDFPDLEKYVNSENSSKQNMDNWLTKSLKTLRWIFTFFNSILFRFHYTIYKLCKNPRKVLKRLISLPSRYSQDLRHYSEIST